MQVGYPLKEQVFFFTLWELEMKPWLEMHLEKRAGASLGGME